MFKLNFLNISQSALCNLESEKSQKVDFYVIYGICKFFNINFNSFLKEKHFIGFGKDGRKEGRKEGKKEGRKEEGEIACQNLSLELINEIRLLIEIHKETSERMEELNEKINSISRNMHVEKKLLRGEEECETCLNQRHPR